MSKDDAFDRDCTEAAKKVVNVLFGYPNDVLIAVVPGVMASIALTFGIPRAVMIAMFDEAVKDMQK